MFIREKWLDEAFDDFWRWIHVAYAIVVENRRWQLAWIHCLNDDFHFFKTCLLILFFWNQAVIGNHQIVKSVMSKLQKVLLNFTIQNDPLLTWLFSQKALKNAKFLVYFLYLLLLRLLILIDLLLLFLFLLAIHPQNFSCWVSVGVKLAYLEFRTVRLCKSMDFFQEWDHLGLAWKNLAWKNDSELALVVQHVINFHCLIRKLNCCVLFNLVGFDVSDNRMRINDGFDLFGKLLFKFWGKGKIVWHRWF